MPYYQDALFPEEQKDGPIAQKLEKGPRPPVRKSMGAALIDAGDIRNKDEVMRLFNACTNRMFLPSANHLEFKIISKHLEEAVNRTKRPLYSIVGQSELILKAMRNMYVTQAIFFASEGESYKYLKQINDSETELETNPETNIEVKKKILRR